MLMVESKHSRKKRKELYTLPLHKRHVKVSAHLSKELRKTYKKRSFPVIKGDKVKIMRGRGHGKEGHITGVDLTAYRVFVEGIVIKKPDGKELPLPVHPSAVMITEFKMTDERRKTALGRLK
jgi:large subunit ribosomal protein L24